VPRTAQAEPAPGSTRERVLLASRHLLLALHRIPRWVLTGILVLLILVGLFGPQWPAVMALAVIVAILGWLVAMQGLSGGRLPVVLRIGSLVVLAVVLVLRATGHG
jgi:hypothetical protein